MEGEETFKVPADVLPTLIVRMIIDAYLLGIQTADEHPAEDES